MSNSSTQTVFGIPNVNVAIMQQDGFVSHPWYLYFTQLKNAANAAGGGLTSLVIGDGLETDVSGGTITTTGTVSLDLDFYGQTEGTILFRGPEEWEGLGPGTLGQVLTSNGEAPPSWAPVTDIVPDVAPGDLLGNVGTMVGPAQDVTLSALLDVAVGNQQGMIITRGATVWFALPTGLANQILTSGGAGQNVFWADAGPSPTARFLADPGPVVNGIRTYFGLSTDGTQNSGLSTGVGS